MSIKKILIVCWDFAPNRAIGGRRWAKMAKSFLKLNCHISVIANLAKHQKQQKISWISKEEFEKINLHQLAPHFLVNWLNDYSSPIRFFKIRLAKYLLSFFYAGTVFDKAIGVEKEFIRLASKIIKEKKIETIFVTGAPFNLIYYTAKLKVNFPSVKIVADYRDPWIKAQNYGMKGLTAKRKEMEIQKQNYVFEKVNYITAPNYFLLDEIKNSYSGKKSKIAKFIELPHAFDPEDTLNNKVFHKEKNKIKIVYAGTLYIGIDKYLNLLNEAISYINKKVRDTQIELFIYTDDIIKKDIFDDNKDCVFFSKPIGDLIFDKISQADFILILLSEHNKNYLTSKFFEFLPYKKPFIYVGPNGYVSNKIENEMLGVHLKEVKSLNDIIHKPIQEIFKSQEIDKYTFDQVTQDLVLNISLE
jgi:hypothetical protein